MSAGPAIPATEKPANMIPKLTELLRDPKTSAVYPGKTPMKDPKESPTAASPT